MSALDFITQRRIPLLSWLLVAATCTNAQLDPNEVTFTHAAIQMYVDLRACFKVQYSVYSVLTRPKRDVFALHYQCFMWTVLPFPRVCARNKIVRSEGEREKSHHQLPQPFDPQPSQLFSITFKLLFTRSQRIDLKVWLSPLRSFLLFVFRNNFSIIYLSAKQVFKVFVIVCLYMCGRFVFDQNFVLGFT